METAGINCKVVPDISIPSSSRRHFAELTGSFEVELLVRRIGMTSQAIKSGTSHDRSQGFYATTMVASQVPFGASHEHREKLGEVHLKVAYKSLSENISRKPLESVRKAFKKFAPHYLANDGIGGLGVCLLGRPTGVSS